MTATESRLGERGSEEERERERERRGMERERERVIEERGHVCGHAEWGVSEGEATEVERERNGRRRESVCNQVVECAPGRFESACMRNGEKESEREDNL